MKRKGSKSEILSERDRFIYLSYDKLKRAGNYKTMYDICKELARMPTECHYISEDMGAIVWSQFKKEGSLPERMNRYKRKIYESFIQLCEQLSREGMPNRKVLRTALAMKAPCLGISPYRIFVILKKFNQK